MVALTQERRNHLTDILMVHMRSAKENVIAYSFIETSSVRDYITSILLPTLSFVVGSFDTLSSLVKWP
jgi:hypothetical protein